MAGTSLLSTVYTVLLLLVFLFSVNCHALRSRHHCDHPSSCGNIRNVSYPFRFKGDPEKCGNKKYELDCEHNRPVLRLFSGKYYVRAINYSDYTIRLVDVGVQEGNCSSLPLHSLSVDNFTSERGDDFSLLATSEWDVVVFVDCQKPVKSPHHMEVVTTNSSTCRRQVTASSSNFSKRNSYSYLVAGGLRVWDVADLCTVNKVFLTTLRDIVSKNESNNFSFVDIHNKMVDGFVLSWERVLCEDCRSDVLIMIAFRYVIPWIKIPGLILAARTLCGILCLFAFLIYKFRRRHLSMFDTIEDFLQSQNNLMPIRYSYFQIKKMTKGFKDKLGEGGYGRVYKGQLRSGYVAAIKLLGKSKANGQDFINEVATIGRIHHVNVVRLIGFCVTRSKRALVYEFMPNGSLEKYIFSKEGNVSLSCKQMYEISLGVARGIQYLHRGCDMQILHFDIKPHNILLDENFNPKISDFGLAKLYPTDNSLVSLTAARGTMGYMAPELFYKNIGRVSYKADVYSYGMLLMELAGRRRNLNAFADHTSQIYFPSWIYDQFKEGNELEMGETTEEEREMVRKMVITALWCIQMRPGDRPSMDNIVKMLEGSVGDLEMPPKPFMTPQEMPAED